MNADAILELDYPSYHTDNITRFESFIGMKLSTMFLHFCVICEWPLKRGVQSCLIIIYTFEALLNFADSVVKNK